MDKPFRSYINPLTDFGFKKVFGDEEIMREFLNDIIEPKSPIVSLTFIDKEMKPETQYDHGVVYDMRCRLESGEEVIVEMQNRSQDFFRDRICFYMSHAISAQGERSDEGEWAFQIHPVYGVFFMNFHMKAMEADNVQDAAGESLEDTRRKKQPGESHDIRHIAFADVDTHELFSKKMQMWLIELPRYRDKAEADCKDNRDYWLYTLTHLDTMNTAVPFQAQKPVFHKLESIADMAQLTHEERMHYDISINSFRTNLACLKHERNEGRAEGEAIGMMKGEAIGIQKGRAEERAKNKKTLSAIVRNLMANGKISDAEIEQAIRQAEDEVRDIANLAKDDEMEM